MIALAALTPNRAAVIGTAARSTLLLQLYDAGLITVDKNVAYPKTAAEMKKHGKLWRCSRLRQVHRGVKRLTCPGLGFGSFWTARRTLAGYEAMAMIRKGQVRKIGGSDISAQAKFVAQLFQVPAGDINSSSSTWHTGQC